VPPSLDDRTRRIGGASSYDSEVRARGSSQRLRRPPRHTYQRAHSTKEMPASTDPAPAFSPRNGGGRAAPATYHGFTLREEDGETALATAFSCNYAVSSARCTPPSKSPKSP
jgi:hypothetical protein